MERVAFLIEESGERISCLLNPETVELHRMAGVQRRATLGGRATTRGLDHDPLLMTGGGSTEMRLELLFDLSLAEESASTSDVRELTRPLWGLTQGGPPRMRFIWGKSWNIPGVVKALAERLEQFDDGGFPRRSWITLHLLQVEEAVNTQSTRKPPSPQQLQQLRPSLSGPGASTREMPGDGSGEAGERLDQVAQEHFGDPAYWRIVASTNGISDPLQVPAGMNLRLPDPGSAP